MRGGPSTSQWSVISGGRGAPSGPHRVVFRGEGVTQRCKNTCVRGLRCAGEAGTIPRCRTGRWWFRQRKGKTGGGTWEWHRKGKLMGQILCMGGEGGSNESQNNLEQRDCVISTGLNVCTTFGCVIKATIGQRWSRLGEDDGGQESPHRRQNILRKTPKNHIPWCGYSQTWTSSPRPNTHLVCNETPGESNVSWTNLMSDSDRCPLGCLCTMCMKDKGWGVKSCLLGVFGCCLLLSVTAVEWIK